MENHALPHGDVHDFDFLAGHWQVHNRRLITRLRATDDWVEFEGSSRCERYLNGGANIEQIDFPTQGFSGLITGSSIGSKISVGDVMDLKDFTFVTGHMSVSSSVYDGTNTTVTFTDGSMSVRCGTFRRTTRKKLPFRSS